MSQIELTNVSVLFKAKNRTISAVNDVSLAIEAGEIYGIVGLSGAGKSTLVRTINGLQKPSTGLVKINGIDITSLTKQKLKQVRRKIGFIFQNFNLISNRTVGQNIAFALTAGGYPEKEQPAKINELLSLVGLADRVDNYPNQLSGGQKQRVGIARALANEPEILLCDEATSALDVATAEEIVNLLKDINKRLKITIVFITHQMEVAKKLFNRMAVMDNGVVVETGKTYEIFANPQSPMAKKLVNHVLAVAIPSEIKQQLALQATQGQILTLKYHGEDSLHPLITAIARETNVDISILQGHIEFIEARAIGILSIYITGETLAIKKAVAAFNSQVTTSAEVGE